VKRIVLVALAVTVAAFMSAAPAGAGSKAQVLKFVTASGLKYNVKVVKASAGKVTIKYTNNSGIQHDVTIAKGSKKIGATKKLTKGTATTTVTLAKGTYTFYCSVDSHKAAGMVGTLKVS
jgi:plastocyanin